MQISLGGQGRRSHSSSGICDFGEVQAIKIKMSHHLSINMVDIDRRNRFNFRVRHEPSRRVWGKRAWPVNTVRATDCVA